jgi:ankyrin repeat protein
MIAYQQPLDRHKQMLKLITSSAPSEQERAWFQNYLDTNAGINRMDEIGGNVLMYYFLFSRPPLKECITYLVEQGNNLNQQDLTGITVMHSAANNPSVTADIFRLLSSLGADGNKIDSFGCNALMLYLLVS